jgi:hypothetical protein
LENNGKDRRRHWITRRVFCLHFQNYVFVNFKLYGIEN